MLLLHKTFRLLFRLYVLLLLEQLTTHLSDTGIRFLPHDLELLFLALTQINVEQVVFFEFIQ